MQKVLVYLPPKKYFANILVWKLCHRLIGVCFSPDMTCTLLCSTLCNVPAEKQSRKMYVQQNLAVEFFESSEV